MARSYTKKSDYWEKRKFSQLPVEAIVKQSPDQELVPAFSEGKHFSVQANCGGGDTNNSSYRNQISPVVNGNIVSAFPLLSAGVIPFQLYGGGGNGYGGNGSYSMAGPIGLAYQSYFNIAIIRNMIDMMTNYSVSSLKIISENATVKNFFANWFEVIGMSNLQSQFFLEYYRSGNVFPYKFNGKIQDDDFKQLTRVFSAKKAIIPIRYTILNPLQVALQVGANTPNTYVRALSPFEITRLAHPKTQEDKDIFNQLDEATKQSIKSGGNWLFVTIPLDPDRLSACFYRKQDYEPLAVPMVFPVLNDVEFKLMLKKMDMSLAATMEQVILLVTTGNLADQYNAKSGKKSLEALQNLFQNQSIGRVLIGDNTTKGQWLVPDLKELLGHEKYTRVDADIKEGLQYIFFGDEKFANAAIKAQVFIESLKEGRRVFMDNFLMPEVKKICEVMNFKHIPSFEFENIRLQDQPVMAKLYYQMGQLGLLTPSEVNQAIDTGNLPTPEESVKHQQEFKKLKDDGLYVPMIGAPVDGGLGKPLGKTGPVTKTVKTPIGQKKAGEEPNYKINAGKLADNVLELNNLRDVVEASLLKRHKLEELNSVQKNVAASIAKSIALNEPIASWKKSVSAYVKEPKDIGAEARDELIDIAVAMNVTEWEALAIKFSQE